MIKNRALRTVRKSIDYNGMSQTAFAKFVGVSFPTIQKNEAGTLKMSRTLAKRIMAQTGAFFPCLLKEGAEAVDLRFEVYTPQSYERWKGRLAPFSAGSLAKAAKDAGIDPQSLKAANPEEIDKGTIDLATNRVKALQVAAGNKLLAIQVLLEEFIEATMEQYNLKIEFGHAVSKLGLSSNHKEPSVRIDYVEGAAVRIFRTTNDVSGLTYFTEQKNHEDPQV